ncbi:hypothetical protein KC342_g1307 [Hortaea werneckii]|nr:hypothetical protein KC342_g1307 [Hortaea werneckii]
MGQELSSAAAGDGNIAVKGAADAAQKLPSAQRESDTRILFEPTIHSHHKKSQSLKKRKRDPELGHAMSLSGSRTPPHRLSNTFHRDQESPVQMRVRSRSPPAAGVRRDESRRLRDHWSPTRWEDPARSSYFEGAQAWSKDHTTSRPSRFSWSPTSSSKNSRRWTPSPPARAFDRALRQPRSPDRPVTSPPRREEESSRSTLWSTAVSQTERYPPKSSRRSPSPPKKDYRNLTWRRSRDSLASNLSDNLKDASRQTSGQRQNVVTQHSLSSPTSPSNSRNLIRSLPTRLVLQNVDASVRAAPHAFLSSRCLPPQQATIQHLRGYFAKRSPDRIFVDALGYYLLFNDDEEGHSNMDKLVAETPHRDKLFGMYRLTLEAYHNGQQNSDSSLTKAFDSHKRSTQELREEAAGLVANDFHQEEDNFMGLSSQQEEDVTRMKDVGENISSTTSKHMQPKQETSRLLSPSRTIGRQDIDDTSSVSARTGTSSELSASRSTRCHVPLPESRDELGSSAQAATNFEPVPDYSRAKHPGSQQSSFQAENVRNVVREGARTSQSSAIMYDTHPSDQEIPKRTSETIGGGPKSPKGSNIINPPDKRAHLDDPSTGSLSHVVAGVPKETGKAQHSDQHLDFEDDEASDLVERSFTQRAPSTVCASQDTKACSKPQFKRIKISQEPSKTGQSQDFTSASSKVQPLVAPEPHAQELRRHKIENDKVKSAMHDAEIQNAPEVPESPAELRSPSANGSAAADHFSMGANLRQSIANTDVAAKPKAKRTRQSLVICSVCQENKTYTSNPLAKTCCSTCKQQQQQEQITAKGGKQCADKDTGAEPRGSEATAVGSKGLSREDHKEGTDFVRPMEAAESKERNDNVQVKASGFNGESSDSLAPNGRTASTVPAHMDIRNSTGFATIPATLREDQIEHKDTLRGRETKTPDDVEVGTSVQENVCEERLLDRCSTIEDSRPTKRKRRNFTDGNFPGNSHARAKGSYIRLIGMALCDAPNHRMQLRGIAAWIAENIPSYDLGVGNWEHGLDVTLRAHVGDRGKMMFKMIDFKPGIDDDRHGSKEWYQMHETVAKTHERWDPDLKQAVSPPSASFEETTGAVGASQQKKASSHEHGARNDDAPNDHPYMEASLVEALKDRSGQAQSAKSLKGSIGSHQDGPSVTDIPNSPKHVDPDDNAASKNTKAREDSENEPLDTVRRRYAAPEAQMKAPEEIGRMQGLPRSKQRPNKPTIAPEEAGSEEGTLPKTNTWRRPTRGVADDDRSLFEPVKQDEQDGTDSTLSLFDEWPAYRTAGQIDRKAKMAEIKSRPSRKAMFGKPALYSRLGSQEASQSGHAMNRIENLSTEKPSEKQGLSARTVAHSIDPFPAERNVVYYDTPEEFFGLPHHLVPVMYNGQLAYRDGTKDHSSRVRKAQAYFPTGLGG